MAASRPRIVCLLLSSQTGFGGKGNGFPSISQAFVSALQMLMLAPPEFGNSEATTRFIFAPFAGVQNCLSVVATTDKEIFSEPTTDTHLRTQKTQIYSWFERADMLTEKHLTSCFPCQKQW